MCEKKDSKFSTNMDVCDVCIEKYINAEEIDENFEKRFLAMFMIPDYYLAKFE